MGRAAMLRVIREVTVRNRLRDGLVYMQVTRGVARRDHAFPSRPIPPAMVITCRRTAPYPTDVDKWAGKAISVPDQRWERCDIKSTGLLPNVLAKQAARSVGAYEAILIDREGMVTEGASSTVWVVDASGTLTTRKLSNAVLPGCTRDTLLTLMAQVGIAGEERAVSEAELHAAREIFVTSATSFVKPITSLDGEKVGDGTVGPITRRLFALFAQHAKGGANTPA